MARPKLKLSLFDPEALDPVIAKAIPRVLKLRKDRDAINSKIKAVKDEIVVAGMARKTFDYILALHAMGPDERKIADAVMVAARKAARMPLGIQMSLFDSIEQVSDDEIARISGDLAEAAETGDGAAAEGAPVH